ncbi:MAG: Fe-S cluster assembly protein SufD [Candidatus Caenarcaniphilales bacterium]|nr:Fe-S cluster assembly protein SufD [Candidatus Caenarcaniphilales bacterium]
MAERLCLENIREVFEKNINNSNVLNIKLKEIAKESFKKFIELGLPNNKQEEWKYLNLEQLLKSNYYPYSNFNPEDNVQNLSDSIEQNIIEECKQSNIVLINGFVSESHSNFSALQNKIFIDSIHSSNLRDNPLSVYKEDSSRPHQNIEKDGGELLNKNFNKVETEDPFVHLNTSFNSEGLFIFIPEGVELKAPIELLLISTNNLTINHPRILIVSGKHSKAKLFIKTIGTNNIEYFSNIVNELTLEENSKLEITYLQKENGNSTQFAFTDARLHESSELDLSCFAYGSHLSRHKISVNLNGRGANCKLNGLYKLSSNHASHNQIVLNHNVANCTSSQFFKGVLDENAKAEFSGTINVAKNAIGTNAEQLNKNLLLSPTAKVDTRPQLQIEADDVKCSHGATTGQLEEEQIFYLTSRGLPKEKSIEVLTKAFSDEVLDRSSFKSYLL